MVPIAEELKLIYGMGLHPDHENIVLAAMNMIGGFSPILKNEIQNGVGIPDFIKAYIYPEVAIWCTRYTPIDTNRDDFHYLSNLFTESGNTLKDNRSFAALLLKNGSILYSIGCLGFYFHAIADFFAHTTWVEHYKSDTIEGLDL